MSDLREKLAHRLIHIDGGVPIPGGWGYENYLRLADECIRQMEWARSQCLAQVGGAAEDTDEAIRALALTPAPNDWKPE